MRQQQQVAAFDVEDRIRHLVDLGHQPRRGTALVAGAPPTDNPNGQPGVSTTFKDEDGSHAIKITIGIYDDPGAATNALNAAKGQQGAVVKDPSTQPSNIGSGGTMLMGNAPDRSKGVVVLLFTEGKALATLEFDGPTDTLAPPEFANDVGQKQDAAIKKGLGG